MLCLDATYTGSVCLNTCAQECGLHPAAGSIELPEHIQQFFSAMFSSLVTLHTCSSPVALWQVKSNCKPSQFAYPPPVTEEASVAVLKVCPQPCTPLGSTD